MGIDGRVESNALDGLPPDLGHDGALSSQVLVAQTQEVVNDERCGDRKLVGPHEIRQKEELKYETEDGYL